MRKLTWALLASVLAFTPAPSFSQPLFAPPVNLGPKINTSAYESDPFWDGPRKRLYFVKWGSMTVGQSEDIWLTELTDTGWTDPKSVGIQINTEDREHSLSISPDGQKLYFIRYPWDVFVSTWDSAQANWGPPVNLGCPISTPVIEFSAKIAPDGKTLFYQSDVGTCDPFGGGPIGLYSSVWDSVSGWSTPQDLGPTINNGNDPQYPSVTADHHWLYFHKFVSDGISIFVSPWTDSVWGPPIDLRPQIGERAGAPSITPSGDRLFLAIPLDSFINVDIFMMRRMSLGIDDERKANLPWDFELYQNYPNPFNAQTQISMFVSEKEKGDISLTIYDILGQPIRHFLKNELRRGEIIQAWDGRDDWGKKVSTGVYLYELRVGNQRVVKKAILLK